MIDSSCGALDDLLVSCNTYVAFLVGFVYILMFVYVITKALSIQDLSIGYKLGGKS